MKYADKMFYRGFAAALAGLARDSNEPRHAAQIAHFSGIKLNALKEAGVDSFDLDALAPEMTRMEERGCRRKRK